jgi:hypothetical protein
MKAGGACLHGKVVVLVGREGGRVGGWEGGREGGREGG